MIAILFSCAAVCFLFAIFPFVFYPFTICVFNLFGTAVTGTKGLEPVEHDRNPKISIVLCAHNEAASIAAKLGNLTGVMASYPGESEALIYLDGCTDDTADIVRAHPNVGPGNSITVVEGLVRAGKSNGMNTLLAQAAGDLVVFTDANVMLEKECLSVAAEAFCDPLIGCICGHLVYVNPDDSVTAEVGSLYWRFEEWLKRLESVRGSTVGADGSLFAIRRNLFRAVPADIIDDMYTSLGILGQGYRVVREDRFRAREMHVVLSSDEFRRKIRITCRAVNCVRFMWPELRNLQLLDQYKIFSHKILRWPVIFLLGVATMLFGLGLVLNGAYATLAILAALILLGGAAARFGIRPFSGLKEILWAFCASGLGVVDSYRGKRYQTWTVAGSSRVS